MDLDGIDKNLQPSGDATIEEQKTTEPLVLSEPIIDETHITDPSKESASAKQNVQPNCDVNLDQQNLAADDKQGQCPKLLIDEKPTEPSQQLGHIPPDLKKNQQQQLEEKHSLSDQDTKQVQQGIASEKCNVQKEELKEPTVEKQIVAPDLASQSVDQATQTDHKDALDKKKEDEKLGIYKALAIKLKKELVKSRDEQHKLREDSQEESNALNKRVVELEGALETEKQTSATVIVTLEAKAKSLKEQLESSENELQATQIDFENYKVRASKIMQQNNASQPNCNKTFEEERYKRLKELNDDQVNRICNLESQLKVSIDRNQELEKESKMLQVEIECLRQKMNEMHNLESKFESLSRENDNLKLALKTYRSKLKEPSTTQSDKSMRDFDPTYITNTNLNETEIQKNIDGTGSSINLTTNTNAADRLLLLQTDDRTLGQDDATSRVSPSASLKDDSQTNSNSSFDGSTSGYVHIKPTTFEIISRSSVLEDAQNQIDNLTKAYLDSENTNSLLSDQVRALKEEIRRMQRGNERMDLAENLEYLKNIVFKFITLDNGQVEQKQRLVPVLSTVLKLSPDETAKLNSLAISDKPSMASSFFKL